MKLMMLGIDHNSAPLGVRERFSMTRMGIMSSLSRLSALDGVSGCIIISTCNRLELWVSHGSKEPDLVDFLSREKQVDRGLVEKLGKVLREERAVQHLFRLSAGLQSLIVGDDQVLTQVKDALSLARDAETADGTLEVLFRMAITSGKKVRSSVRFDKGNRSAAALAVSFFQEQGRALEGRRCLVIGNGEMGKIAATRLVEAGADVTVTVRQYRSGVVCIPKGCRRINYGERYEEIRECDFVFSATASPNVTIRRDSLLEHGYRAGLVLVDLAVPRDVEPEVAGMKGVQLYDLDSLRIGHESDALREQRRAAEEIADRHAREFFREQDGRKRLAQVRECAQCFGEETAWRMRGQIKSTPCSQEEKENLYEAARESSRRVLERCLHALQRELGDPEFAQCLDVIKAALKE